MFILNSDITIGKFHFSGVNNVRITRTLHSIVETAIIEIPARAKLVKNGKADATEVVTGKQFSDGDAVVIRLGYNGDLNTEFKGFVKRRDLGLSLTIECEGYSWLLRRNKVNISQQSMSVKDYLSAAIKGIDGQYTIKIDCELACELSNVQINGNGVDAINSLGKYTDGTVSCFFKEPDVLWCGLLYTNYAEGDDVLNKGKVDYRLGYNVLKDNSLKQRITNDDPIEVSYTKRLSSGDLVSGVSSVFKKFKRTHSKILNQILSASVLKKLADEKAYMVNYAGYEGSLQTFLSPKASPGYLAYVTDGNYEERNGTYAIESVETVFGVRGARRTVEIGARLGFSKT